MNKNELNLELCPCGSNNQYLDCCGLYITADKFPETPEQLMRSRYTAYTMANIDYIFDTMRDNALKNSDRVEALKWAKSSKWLGLEVLKTSVNLENTEGEVEFIAKFQQNSHTQEHREHAKFKKYHNKWYYIGEVPKVKAIPQLNKEKIGRNDECHCGSGKKYKKCCLIK
ncbi:MAG: YchJ family protein [Gammaproteobacteria bacterium]|nr:YchJ family protein [Gammaproteobacteria bacterium]